VVVLYLRNGATPVINVTKMRKVRRILREEASMYRITLAAFVSICAIAGAQAQTPLGGTIPVTVDNILRAETDNYFATNTKDGGLGKLIHLGLGPRS
jgi:hypothetical protein